MPEVRDIDDRSSVRVPLARPDHLDRLGRRSQDRRCGKGVVHSLLAPGPLGSAVLSAFSQALEEGGIVGAVQSRRSARQEDRTEPSVLLCLPFLETSRCCPNYATIWSGLLQLGQLGGCGRSTLMAKWYRHFRAGDASVGRSTSIITLPNMIQIRNNVCLSCSLRRHLREGLTREMRP